MRFDIVTLFPEMFDAITLQGVSGRAFTREIAKVNFWNPRDYAPDKRSTVDDRPFGGGPGMVMKVQPLRDAIETAKAQAPQGAPVVYLSPQGKVLDQATLQRFSELPGMILVAGRYEGIDERLLKNLVDEEISLGDYVLSGGELPAMTLMDGVIRLLPGALGHADSAVEDSFVSGLLDHPHYTRPEEIDGVKVPDVLLGGNHAHIRQWRMKQSLGRTWQRRPDLLEKLQLDKKQQALLDEFIQEME